MRKSGVERETVSYCLAVILVGVVTFLATALALMVAWNIVLVPLAHAQRLTYTMALGIVFLVSFATSLLRGVRSK